MKFLNLASNSSLWRGIDYHHKNRVLSCSMLDDVHIDGEVKGSEDHIYQVHIDIDHPRKSICNCPFADGRRVICKHMIALYLHVFPEKEQQWMDYIEEENIKYEENLKLRFNQRKADIVKSVKKLSKQELQEKLIERMIEDLEKEYYDDYY